MSQKWTSRVQFPRDNFVLRVIDEKFAPSNSSGNPMITLVSETVALLLNDGTLVEEVDIGGEQYMIVGNKVTNYYPTIVLNEDCSINEEKTAKAQERVKVLFNQFKLDSSNINFENPELKFKGKLFSALLYGKEQAQRRSPTKEQLAKGIKEGEIIIDPVTRQPVVNYWPTIDRIYGLHQESANKPFWVMIGELNKILPADCESPKVCEPYVDTLIGNLQRRQSRAKTELDNVTAALDALKKNPEIASVLELIAKAGR